MLCRFGRAASSLCSATSTLCEEPAVREVARSRDGDNGLSPSEKSRWDAVVQKAKALQIEVISDHPYAQQARPPFWSWFKKQQNSPLQIYFMHAVDFEPNRAFPAFFVTSASNKHGDSIASLHSKYHQEVGGLSGTIVPGNKAGYIGGLTANKAIAEMMYSARPTDQPQMVGSRTREELLQYLVEAHKNHQKHQNLSEAEIIKICKEYVDCEDFSFRDFVDMRTGRTVKSVMKEAVPLFSPSAWEELHALLREAAFLGGAPQKLSNTQRMFSSSSDEDVSKDVLVGTSVECFLVGDHVVCQHPKADVPQDTLNAIEKRMKTLKLRYCNAVYEGVTSVEDCGFAFFHILDFEMADKNFADPRNKGLVYTVGPNGNRARYPDDVPVLPTVDAWHDRMRLIGRNIARSVMLYNEFVMRQGDTSWSSLTCLRVNNVGGGMFLLRDAEGKAVIPLDVHTKSFLAGLVSEFTSSTDFAVKRLEIMRGIPTSDKMDETVRGFIGFVEGEAKKSSL